MTGLASGDLDGDGSVELATIGTRFAEVAVIGRGAEGPRLESLAPLATTFARHVVCTYLDGDGADDLVVTAGVQPFDHNPRPLTIVRGRPASAGSPATSPAPDLDRWFDAWLGAETSPDVVRAADLDGDGRVDVADLLMLIGACSDRGTGRGCPGTGQAEH